MTKKVLSIFVISIIILGGCIGKKEITTCTVTGRVTYFDTGVEGVEVHLYNKDHSVDIATYTDSEGNFIFKKVPRGEYYFRTHMSGYHDSEMPRSITLPSGLTKYFSIEMGIQKIVELITPQENSVIDTLRPTFEWEPRPEWEEFLEDMRYEIEIFKTGTEVPKLMCRVRDIVSTCYTLKEPLEKGAEYWVRIYAYYKPEGVVTRYYKNTMLGCSETIYFIVSEDAM